jgi:FKBP-type peptidyl-prolyl cis-trans isomerase 2
LPIIHRHFVGPVLALALVAVGCASAEPAVPASNATPNTEPFVVPRIVQPGDAISVHYVGTLDNGELFDSSRDRGQPLSFTVAAGQMIAGFDFAVQGMRLGELKNVRIDPLDAYGPRSEPQIILVPLDQLPAGVVAGDLLSSSSRQAAAVIEVGETDAIIEIDTNHRLAGEALNFEIEIVSFNSPGG